MRKIFLLLGFLILISIGSFAQNGIIRGFLYDKETGEPVLFGSVYLYKTTYGAATDENGHFTISKIPSGNYVLMVTYLGYDTIREDVTIANNSVLTRKLYLNKSSVNLEGVSISAEYQEYRTESRTSVNKVTPKQLKQIPSIGGQADLAQYIQVLPGVVFTGDQGGQIYIRGGSPIQNKVILDGMVIYNPFHSIGLFSVFETETLRTADVYTGGFGAEYGGRISSVMDLVTRDGNKNRVTGKVGASTFGAKMLLEGPIFKSKSEASGSSTFILTAKNSYLAQSSKLLYSYIDEGGLPFNFTDIYGKVSFSDGNGSKFNLFAFNYNDSVKYKAISDFGWNATGIGSNFVLIPGSSASLLEGSISYSAYKLSLEQTNAPERMSSINNFTALMSMTSFMGKSQVKSGFELSGLSTRFNYTNNAHRVIDHTKNTSEIAMFVTYKYQGRRLIIEPGFRLHAYVSLPALSPEPRISAKYIVSDKLRFKLASGIYSQNIIAASSDYDVVNLFYGFLAEPDNLQENFDGNKISSRLQKSEHLIVGVELEPAKFFLLNIEGYYKNFSQLININRNKIFDADDESVDERYRTDFLIEKGNATGMDISLKYDNKIVNLWFVYSLGYVNRYDGLLQYVPHYDRRHNINIVTSYTWGKNDSWEINGRWNLGSGFPFTKTLGYYENLTFPEGISSNIVNQNGELAIYYDEYNKGRLPYYHRLDLGLTKKFVFSEHTFLEANLSATNVYNRKNIFYVDRVSNEKVYQLPFMLSGGLNFSF